MKTPIKSALAGPLAALAALGLSMPPLHAQQQAQTGETVPYVPIMFPFTGNEGLALSAAQALEINGSGTIEFWVSAKWSQPLDYDPAIMAYGGPLGVRFALVISGDKSGLGLVAGEFYDGVAFDFSDGMPHHVAITTIGDTTEIYIDGELQDILGFTFADLPADTFTLGSVSGYSPFIGELGQVRIWDEPVDIAVINYFKMRPIEIAGSNAHPDIDSLVGMSAFGNPEMRGFVFVGDPQEPNLTVPLAPPRTAAALAPRTRPLMRGLYSMKRITLSIALAVIGCAAVAAPIESVEAQRFRGAGKVKKPKKPTNFRAVKQSLRPFKARGKTAYNNWKAASRSEQRNREVKLQALATYNASVERYRANRNDVSAQQAVRAAKANLDNRTAQHNNALNVWRAAKDQVDFITGQRNAALNQARSRAGQAVRAPRRGQPRANPQRRVANQRIGASMVQNPRQMITGGPMVHREPSPLLAAPRQQGAAASPSAQAEPQPAIVANPGAFPQAALNIRQPANGQQLYGINTPPGGPYFRPPAPVGNLGVYGTIQLAPANPYTAGPVRQNANQYESTTSALN